MGHRMHPEKRAALFWSKVDRRGPSECWPWLGKPDPCNYGRFTWDGSREGAHRVAYMLGIGPIPDGLVIDHRCHTDDPTCRGGDACPHRLCQNPRHLETCTRGENTGRGRTRLTHCPQGHPYDEANTYRGRRGRECRACHRVTESARRAELPKLPPKPNSNGRKTHCKEGHAYAGDNLFINSEGRRRCRLCHRARSREANHRRAARVAASST
jgi:hypothetical protein